jgi:hypothetical protein
MIFLVYKVSREVAAKIDKNLICAKGVICLDFVIQQTSRVSDSRNSQIANRLE